jgi:hypothetical protein
MKPRRIAKFIILPAQKKMEIGYFKLVVYGETLQ